MQSHAMRRRDECGDAVDSVVLGLVHRYCSSRLILVAMVSCTTLFVMWNSLLHVSLPDSQQRRLNQIRLASRLNLEAGTAALLGRLHDVEKGRDDWTDSYYQSDMMMRYEEEWFDVPRRPRPPFPPPESGR